MANNVDPDSDSDQPHISCPICLEIFDEPKVLKCGHSLCAHCVPPENSEYVICPVCREQTELPENGLPINYSLRELVEEGKNKRRCKKCNEECKMENMWACSDCDSTLICSMCAMKDHRNHNAQLMTEFLDQGRLDFAEWRQLAVTMMDDIDSGFDDMKKNFSDSKRYTRGLQVALAEFGPDVDQIMQRMDNDQEAIQEELHSISDASTVDGLVISGQQHSFMDGTMKKLKLLNAKHRILKSDMALVLDVVRNSDTIVRDALNRMCNLDKLAEQELQKEEEEGKPLDGDISEENGQLSAAEEGPVDKRRRTCATDDEDEEDTVHDQADQTLSLDGVRQFYISIDAKRDKLPKSVALWERSAKVPKSIELCKLFNNDQIVVFCPERDTAEWLAQQMEREEIHAAFVDFSMKEEERNDVIDDFLAGEFRVLVIPVQLASFINVQSIRVIINIGVRFNNQYMCCAGRSQQLHFDKPRIVINLVRFAREAKRLQRHFHTTIEKMPEDIQGIL